MKRVLQVAGWLVIGVGALWFLGPRENVPPVELGGVEGNIQEIAQLFASEESTQPDLTPGVEKRIIFADGPKKTEWSVVYLHGFSATSEEIRPVPDKVAKALGANLFYARFTGHGQSGKALAQARAEDWIEDTREAMTVGAMLGEKTLVMGTSTGATLGALAAHTDAASRFVFFAPNFALQAAGSELLTLPFARHWVPLVAGAERSWEPLNERHGKFWTTSYPTVAVMPLAAVTKAARDADYSDVKAPALVFLSDADQVVKPEVARDVMANWGGGAEIVALEMGEGDDPFAHVIAGDIMSPGQTDMAVAKILSWLENQP